MINNTKLSSIAAVAAKAVNTKASAGIGASTVSKNLERTVCMNNAMHCNESMNACMETQHQIGTNLADLTVCWHKLGLPEHCVKCGEPFYKANQFSCEKCEQIDEFLIAGTLSDEFFDSIKKNKFHKTDSNCSTLLSIINSNSPSLNDGDSLKYLNELPVLTYLTRKNFEQEFSSLVITTNKNLAILDNKTFQTNK